MMDLEALRTVVKSSDLFASDLYKAIIEGEESNLICSPISLSIVLSMATIGARGNTEKQLKTALHSYSDDDVIKKGYQTFLDTINAVKSVELCLANKIFVGTIYKVKPQFVSIMKDYFRSASQQVNFANNIDASKTINSWCAENTKNRIKEVIKPTDLNELTALVLVNAIYFKGTWTNQFDADDTIREKFYINPGTKKNVLMMHQSARFNFGRLSKLDAQYIELPYKSSSAREAISMFIILPNKKDGLKHVEKNLHHVDFKELHDNDSTQEVRLALPKFKLESTIELNSILKKMGMTDMFDDDIADLSETSDVKGLYVSKVIQKAFIEVNEVGSEAAAVTALIMKLRCLPPRRIPEMSVDRPFFCSIVATYTGAQLFNARVIDPSQ